jgi:hypothetical protein
MTLRRLSFLFLFLAAFAFAADVTGKWTSTFESGIGEQTYTFTFKLDGEKLTGTAKSATAETAITEGVVKGDDISFVEPLEFDGQPLRIEYKGKIAGDEMKLTRKVGDFGTEELTAKRVK